MEKEIEKTKPILEKIKRHIEYQETIEILEKYIKELEQKEAILDKVTDKLKEMDKKYINEYKRVDQLELYSANVYVEQELACVLEDIDEALNIIEKKCDKST